MGRKALYLSGELTMTRSTEFIPEGFWLTDVTCVGEIKKIISGIIKVTTGSSERASSFLSDNNVNIRKDRTVRILYPLAGRVNNDAISPPLGRKK